MTLYEQITSFALASGHHDASEAWEEGKREAAARSLGTESSRDKGCPRSAFISLAEHGYIAGFRLQADRPLTLNAQHVLDAAKVLKSNRTLSSKKSDWWRKTAKRTRTSRQGHNGVLDVLAAVIAANRFIGDQEDD